ncbi:MAG TPA: anaerobic ribonucleoside-triphosphate reductase activating protein [Deltaproteobacteria bacterium]|nr:anaerobic ribonucleoside-triphosphate reductase activating protein [Deltaproteobacteria bacterium]
MIIGYLQKSSLIDYPGRVCAVVFTMGCNFRCPYCHNPELVDGSLPPDLFPIEEVMSFLETRVGKLDAVSITGGEPCLQADLIPFMRRVRDLGFLVKLDTNGSRPDVLAQVIEEGLADYLAMDIKAPLGKYPLTAGKEGAGEHIKESIGMIMGSPVPYEFRTTLVDRLLRPSDILEIGGMIKGARRYVLQRFVPTKPLDPSYADAWTFSDGEIAGLLEGLKHLVASCGVR